MSCRGTGFKPDIEPPSDTCGGAQGQPETTSTIVGGVSRNSDDGAAALVCGEDSATITLGEHWRANVLAAASAMERTATSGLGRRYALNGSASAG